MLLFKYIRNAIAYHCRGMILYFTVSLVADTAFIWLIYEKLFRLPHGILVGLILSITLLFLFSSSLGTSFFQFCFKKYGEANKVGCCPHSRALFEEVKQSFVEEGHPEAARFQLFIMDSQVYNDTSNIICRGDTALLVNDMSDEIPDAWNRYRFFAGINDLLNGAGYFLPVATAAIMPILAVFAFLVSMNQFFVQRSKRTGNPFQVNCAGMMLPLYAWISLAAKWGFCREPDDVIHFSEELAERYGKDAAPYADMFTEVQN